MAETSTVKGTCMPRYAVWLMILLGGLLGAVPTRAQVTITEPGSGIVAEYSHALGLPTGMVIGTLIQVIDGIDVTDGCQTGGGTARIACRWDGVNWLPFGDGTSDPGSGEANTSSNAGAGGVGFALPKSGVNLPFKNANAASNKISIVNDAGNSEVDWDVVEANVLLENLGGLLPAAKGGTGTANTATLDRYLKGTGTAFITSTLPASGTGVCTNQVVTGLNSDAAPTCGSITEFMVDTAMKDGSPGTPSLRSLGTQSFQAAAGADTRLSNPRTPIGASSGCDPNDIPKSLGGVWVCGNDETGGGGGTDDQTAAEVSSTPTGSIAATNVQAALAEVDSEKAAVGDSRFPTADEKAGLTVHGPSAANPVITQTELDSHSVDTTNQHGITDTANLVLTNDSRLTDARTPTAHAGSHGPGQVDDLSLIYATKTYADAISSGLQPKARVHLATTTTLPANTYANGTAGVGATLTRSTNGTVGTIDGDTLALNEYLLVKDEASGLTHGIYQLTTVGDGSTPYVLTRRTDLDTDAELNPGVSTYVERGTALTGNAGKTFFIITADPITVGTTAIVWDIFQSTPSFQAGSGLTLDGDVFNVGGSATITAGADALSVAAGSLTNTQMSATIQDPTAGTPGLRTLGTGAQQSAAGNDSRLSDQRTPTDNSVTSAKVVNETLTHDDVAAANKDGVASTPSMRTLGTGATQAAAGSDSRFTDTIDPARLLPPTTTTRGPLFSSTCPANTPYAAGVDANGDIQCTADVTGSGGLPASVTLSNLVGESVTAASFIPAGSWVLGIQAQVLTTITGPESFQVGTPDDPTRWGAEVALAAGTVTDIPDFTVRWPENYRTATDVVLTPNGGDFTAGEVRLYIYYTTLASFAIPGAGEGGRITAIEDTEGSQNFEATVVAIPQSAQLRFRSSDSTARFEVSTESVGPPHIIGVDLQIPPSSTTTLDNAFTQGNVILNPTSERPIQFGSDAGMHKTHYIAGGFYVEELLDSTGAPVNQTINVGAGLTRTYACDGLPCLTLDGTTGKATFRPDATDAGLNVGSYAGDPSAPANGDTWYNSATNKFRCRENGTSQDCLTTPVPQTDIGASVRRTTNQSISNNNTSGEAILFDVEDYDTDTMHSTASLTDRIVFTTAGKYLINCSVRWAAHADGERAIWIERNGTTGDTLNVASMAGHSTFLLSQHVSKVFNASAGNYIRLMAFQNSSAALNVLSRDEGPGCEVQKLN
jgi:hypothetical protein